MATSDRGGTRNGLLAVVHVAKKTLALADDDYRAIICRITGKSSSADCSPVELHRLIAEFERLGYRGNAKRGQRSNRASHPIAKKARALWIGLHALGAVGDSSERALETFGKRQLGVDRLHWADQAEAAALIEALKSMAERAGWQQAVPPRLTSAQRGRLLTERLFTVLASRLDAAGIAHAAIALDTLTDGRLHEAIAEYGALLRSASKAGEQ